jgi:signal transduction histidine kinase
MPLTKIKLAVESAELAQRTGRTDVDWRRTVRAETQHLIRLVDNMLRASRIEAGEVQVAAEPVALLPLVRQAIRAYQEPKRFRVQTARRLPLALADRELLQIVLNNLFNNAVSYSPLGAPVHVTIAQLDESCLQISIRDEGEGIPPEKLAHVFERFHRLDQKDARRTYGFGLGLYIARGLIEAQGGNIVVESELGRGSDFRFTLPVYREDLSHAHPDD